MRKEWLKKSLAVFLVLGGMSAVGFAQLGVAITANVPFEFFLGGEKMPAGTYKFTYDSATQSVLTVTSERGNRVFTIVTRLGGYGDLSHQPGLVFDKLGERHYLSEVWVPDMDGFLIQSTAEQHSHRIVKALK